MAEKIGDPGEYGKFRKIVTKKTADDKFPASILQRNTNLSGYIAVVEDRTIFYE